MRRFLLFLSLMVFAVLLVGSASAAQFRDGQLMNARFQTYFVTTADFNNDGHVDLAFAAYTKGQNVGIFLGRGDGTFGKALGIAVDDVFPTSLAAGDLNGDGIPDLVVGAAAEAVVVYLGNGDGTLRFAAKYHAASYFVALADFDGDGVLDIAASNTSTPSADVLLGKGDGSFQRPVTYLLPYYPQNLVVNDYNADGHPDLAVVVFCDPELEDCPVGEVSVLLNRGDGTFNSPLNFDVGPGPIGITSADLNHDGKTDLVVTNGDFGLPGTISVLQGNGDGTFHPAVDHEAGDGPYAVVADDFDGDGNLDLAVANVQDFKLSLFRGHRNGTFHHAISYPTGAGPVSLAVADFNEDGAPDLAVALYLQSDVSILINSGVH